ncbi:hypothetical protein QVD17_14352 [Tagetes erecta]|uniref:Uncharacterized protein n=1 Tax=Tagetes erecta TaxID=13708 RepID=A0AAD8KY36_TARER|nr:hypothetical protein QVD17_14352 [Tagetes erecta]
MYNNTNQDYNSIAIHSVNGTGPCISSMRVIPATSRYMYCVHTSNCTCTHYQNSFGYLWTCLYNDAFDV